MAGSADRSAKVRLSADVDQYIRDMQRAARASADIGKNGSASAKSMGDHFKAAGQVAVTAMSSAVLATGGIAVAAFKAGASYNILQQNSRAALKTLLGGAEAANAQMNLLDEFARNSPFSKAVFVAAQQQLLGFGVEAEKVIPILDAIQNSIAAAGGSSTDIAGLVAIFAKIKSSAKITGVDLMQFGNRGVDAAGIIGSAMGKTGPEIRAAITEGTLGAEEALDALTKGMMDTYGGAADGVKQQFTGAADRVKAAFRDIGSILAAPFIDPMGGGMAVTWTNQLADLMRAAQRKISVAWDMIITSMGGAWDGISSTLVRAREAVEGLTKSDIAAWLSKLSQAAPVVAGLGAAIVTSGAQSIPILGRLFGAINPVAAGLVAMTMASPELRGALGSILDALSPLLPVAGNLAGVLTGVLIVAIKGAAAALEVIAVPIKWVGELFASLPDPVGVAIAAITALILLRGPIQGFFLGVAASAAATSATLARSSASWAFWSASAGRAVGAAGAVVGGFGKVARFLGGPWGLAIGVGVTALASWIFSAGDAETKANDLSGAIDRNTGTWGDNAAAIVTDELLESAKAYEAAGGSADDYTAAILGSITAQAEVSSAIADSGAELVRTTPFWGTYADELTAAGVTAKDIAKAFLEGGPAMQAMSDKMQEAVGPTADMGMAMGEITTAMEGSSGLYAQYQTDLDSAGAALKEGEVAARANAGATDELGGSLDAAAKKAAEAEEDMSGLEIAMKRYKDDTERAKDQTDLFAAALESLISGSISVEAAVRAAGAANREIAASYRDQQESIQKVREAEADLQKVKDEGRKKDKESGEYTETQTEYEWRLADATRAVEAAKAGVAGAADKQAAAYTASADASRDLVNSLFEQDLATLGLDGAVQNATANMEKERKAFIASAIEAGKSAQEAEALATAQGLIPGAVETKYLSNADAAISKGESLFRVQDSTTGEWRAMFMTEGDAEAKMKAGNLVQAYNPLTKTYTANLTALDFASGVIDAINRKVLQDKQFTITQRMQVTGSSAMALEARAYTGGRVGKDGKVHSFARGGSVPSGLPFAHGPIPSSLMKDNLLAVGPTGDLINFRGDEHITNPEATKAAQHLLAAINNGQLTDQSFAMPSGAAGSFRETTSTRMPMAMPAAAPTRIEVDVNFTGDGALPDLVSRVADVRVRHAIASEVRKMVNA